jgi:hypothetical protein
MKITKLRGRDKKLYRVDVIKKVDEQVSYDVYGYNDHI